ncbi:winged helix-turn-helix domain-containing protein [Actinomycetes bacterium KLBMP 9797]
MLRIVFTNDDIARTRVAPGADPVWETVLSLHVLRNRVREPTLARWGQDARGRLRRDGGAASMRLFFAINPPKGYFPDFLTPSDSAHGFEAGLDAIRATPAKSLQRDLSLVAAERALPATARGLANGDRDAVQRLAESMRRYQELVVAPYWAAVQAAVAADRAARARSLLDGGTEGLLAGLRPSIRWRSGVLEVHDYPTDRELHLDGRGLTLVPAFFCARTPVALVDPTLPPVLVYPVDRLAALSDRSGGGAALASLMGRTRALVLDVVGDGGSTGEIARRLSISPAAASQHATVLREAGLLVSRREANTVLHTLTPLGRALLNSS